MKKEQKSYTHLLSPEDRYSPSDDLPIVDPPPPSLIAQLFRSVRAGPAAFKAFIPSTSSWDRSILLSALDASGQNFLHMAAEVGDPGTLSLLREEIFLNRHRETPQHLAIREKLPRQRDVHGNRPLHVAARNDNLRFVKGLIHWHTFGYVDFDEDERDDPPMLSPTGRYPVSREEIRYILPLLDYRNDAGRTAAMEARFAGARETAEWLEAFKRQFVGEDDSGDEEGLVDVDVDGERFLSNRCTVL